jgi:hypothetical protein
MNQRTADVESRLIVQIFGHVVVDSPRTSEGNA